MYVMIDGEVDVVQQQAEGGERVVATLTQGEWFGEMALFNEEPRSATVRTLTNVNVLSVDRRTFQILMAHIATLREAFERLMQHREAADKGTTSAPRGGAGRVLNVEMKVAALPAPTLWRRTAARSVSSLR